MAPKRSPEELLSEANSRLKAGRLGVAISPVRGMLYLRATLPPKPSSKKDTPYQQRVALGVRFNPAGIKRAEAEAHKLAHEVAMGQFDWENWQRSPKSQRAGSAQTVADWVKAFEKDYFARRERNPKSETTWDKDYRLPLLRLPQHRRLTPDLLIETITGTETWKPDSRSRQRACDTFGRFARFAGIQVDLKPYRGNYSPKAVDPRNLPSDDQIIEVINSLKDERWQFLVMLMATYGLRDHEVFHLDLSTLKEPPGVCTVLDGKTGWRQVWPYAPEWWEKFELHRRDTLPNLTARRNSDYGVRISQYFKRRNLPFAPYDLRHAWAGRSAIYGLDPAIAAKMMGHDLGVHTRVYHQFISKASLQAAWERSQGQ